MKNFTFLSTYHQLKITGKIIFITVVSIFIWIPESSAETGYKKANENSVKVLTIGNSFADNAVTFLKSIAESVPGNNIHVTKANIGGCSLERHVNLIDACEKDPTLKPYANKHTLKELLQLQDYDYVTIQQVSRFSFRPETFQPYTQELINYIRKFQPNAEILIHQTWAYPNENRLKEWKVTYEEMHNKAVENYEAISQQYNLRILPVGEAFFNTKINNNELDLWKEDRHHANDNGCYLAGCIWFGIMFDTVPRKINFIPNGMQPKVARLLQKTASKQIRIQRQNEDF